MMAAATASSASAECGGIGETAAGQARAGMKAQIRRNIEDGDVPRGTDAAALSDFYVTIINGMS
jgi:hypothetical protein